MLKLSVLLAAVFLAACAKDTTPTAPAEQPTRPDAPFPAPDEPMPAPVALDGHTVTRLADNCVFEDFFVGAVPAGKTLAGHNWARDRYDEGLVIDYQFEDSYEQYAAEFPVMRQALSLVADTLYASFLPTHGLDTLQVRVRIKSLKDDYILAQAGGNFYRVGSKKGLPRSGDVYIEINQNIFQNPNDADHPRYVSAMADWYLLFLHEMFHVLGFGLSPKWDDIAEKKRYDYFVCDRELDWFGGHWGSGSEYNTLALMRAFIYPRNTLIVPETWCAFESIGWELR